MRGRRCRAGAAWCRCRRGSRRSCRGARRGASWRRTLWGGGRQRGGAAARRARCWCCCSRSAWCARLTVAALKSLWCESESERKRRASSASVQAARAAPRRPRSRPARTAVRGARARPSAAPPAASSSSQRRRSGEQEDEARASRTRGKLRAIGHVAPALCSALQPDPYRREERREDGERPSRRRLQALSSSPHVDMAPNARKRQADSQNKQVRAPLPSERDPSSSRPVAAAWEQAPPSSS